MNYLMVWIHIERTSIVYHKWGFQQRWIVRSLVEETRQSVLYGCPESIVRIEARVVGPTSYQFSHHIFKHYKQHSKYKRVHILSYTSYSLLRESMMAPS